MSQESSNLLNETMVSLQRAARVVSERLPERRGGRKVHVSTVHRWITRGIKGIRLEYTQVGGTRATTLEALERFFSKLAGRTTAEAVMDTSRRRRIDEAERKLKRAGI